MNPSDLAIEKTGISVNPAKIESLMGLPAHGSDPFTLEVIERNTGRCLELFEPGGGYISLSALPNEDTSLIRTNSGAFHTGPIIGSALSDAEEFYFFLGTAGAAMEELSGSLIEEGNPLEGFVVNLIASSLAESVAENLHRQIGNEAKQKGKEYSNRYSPGYCDWNVGEQQKLFRLFPENYCGIRLSDSSLMSPIKSVSGVVATGTDISFRDYTCDSCNRKNCPYRNSHSFFRY